MSPCGRIMITSGKGRKEGAERAIWIERMSFWTGGSVDSDTPAKWIQQHYVTSLDCTTKFNPGSEHTGLVNTFLYMYIRFLIERMLQFGGCPRLDPVAGIMASEI